MPSETLEVRPLEIIEHWLTCELARHASRAEKMGWRSPTGRRRVTIEHHERLYAFASRDLAPAVEELRRLGYAVPAGCVENAIFRAGRRESPAVVAAEFLRRVLARSDNPEDPTC